MAAITVAIDEAVFGERTHKKMTEAFARLDRLLDQFNADKASGIITLRFHWGRGDLKHWTLEDDFSRRDPPKKPGPIDAATDRAVSRCEHFFATHGYGSVSVLVIVIDGAVKHAWSSSVETVGRTE